MGQQLHVCGQEQEQKKRIYPGAPAGLGLWGVGRAEAQ